MGTPVTYDNMLAVYCSSNTKRKSKPITNTIHMGNIKDIEAAGLRSGFLKFAQVPKYDCHHDRRRI